MNRKLNFSQTINETLKREMSRDKSIFLIGEDIGVMGGRARDTEGLLELFGKERVLDMPLNEELFIGMAIGAAQMSLRPVVEFAHGPLMHLASADIARSGIWKLICMQEALPIVIRARCGTIAGPELSYSMVSYLVQFPGISVVAPSTSYQIKGILAGALRGKEPIIVLEYSTLYGQVGEVPDEDYVLPIGQAELRREGKDVSLITYGSITDITLKAADKLSEKGIESEVLDLVSLKPLDEKKILKTAEKTGNVFVIADESENYSSIFLKIHYLLSQKLSETKINFVGSLNVPIPFGPIKDKAFVDSSRIVDSVVSKIC